MKSDRKYTIIKQFVKKHYINKKKDYAFNLQSTPIKMFYCPCCEYSSIVLYKFEYGPTGRKRYFIDENIFFKKCYIKHLCKQVMINGDISHMELTVKLLGKQDGLFKLRKWHLQSKLSNPNLKKFIESLAEL